MRTKAGRRVKGGADGRLSLKLESLRRAFREKGKVLVAFSGGVDSSVVAKLAFDELGEGALAVIADSETMARSELETAKRVAKEIGMRVKVIRYSELDDERFAANPPDRCYHCRKNLSVELGKVARSEGIGTIADGITASDLGEHRPGIKAADEEGVWHPLVEAGLAKEDVRALARLLGLSVSEKPSTACMSSRIPYGERITKEKLDRVEGAEAILKEIGFVQVRVRAHGGIARIEVPRADIARFMRQDVGKLARRLKGLGFAYVTLDLEGYRSGSMDEVL